MRYLPLLFLGFIGSLLAQDASNEIVVDLRNPHYKNGILYTTQGGVIKNQDIRIQARSIQYTQKTEAGEIVHRIEAEGDLMIQYKGRVFIGSELEYDFVKKTGIVYEGKTFSSLWYVGGDEIQLAEDGSYKVSNAYITTCENQDSSWDLHARQIDVAKGELFEAKKVSLRLFKIPTFWFPSLKINLKKFKEPFFRYTFAWDKGAGPEAGIRCQLYSWEDFALYGRLEYRLKIGWGGALETEYLPEHKKISFITRNYVGKDILENAPKPAIQRYRVQGAFNALSDSEKTTTVLTWDKYSDVRMPNDFRSEDFEVNTAKRTILYVRHQEEDLITALKIRPRVNSFESIKQDLPTLFASVRPFEIGSSGFFSSTFAKASYLDYNYSDQLTISLKDYRSSRLELRERLSRPTHLGPLIVTPFVGGAAILYGSSPSHEPQNVGFLNYGVRAHVQGQRTFSRYKHIMEPYFTYEALTRPTGPPDGHYIFSIQDGYDKIQQVQIGIRHLLFSKKRPGKEASFSADLYANAFFSDPVIPQVFPRLYLWLGWRLRSVDLSFHNAWNFRNHVLDFSKARCKWTINENIALSLEGRYRSEYDWRKADHENFILDVTRPQSDLLLSPLSDRRITLLTKLFVRLTPFWECAVESHHGFYRMTETPYNEYKLDLFTWIGSAWKLRLSVTHTDEKRLRFGMGLNLVKK